jgi:hypothetical protein
MSEKISPRPSILLMSLSLLMVCVLGMDLVAQPAKVAGRSWEKLLGDNHQELWRGYKEKTWPKGWKLENGVLARTGSGGDLMTVATYGDFDLQLEWKISTGGNSGVMYRVSTGDNAPYFSGPEFQLLDDEAHPDSAKTETSTGSLYALYGRKHDVAKPVGEWNSARIVLRGNHVEHWLNGKKVVECEMGSDDWNRRVKNSKFAEWAKFGKNREGHIALQDHGNPVWFRNIRVRRLKSKQ